jgi:hypothetical protein
MAEEEASPAPAATPEPSPGPLPLPPAWQPFSARGIAAFSVAGATRLWLLELAVALIAAVTVVWFLATAWFPEVRQAIANLPDQGLILDQQLRTPLPPVTILAEGPRLGFIVDRNDLENAVASSDIRVEFHRTRLVVGSIFGSLVFAYPKGWSIQFNRTELLPTWGAWEPILLGLAALGVIAGLLLSWAILAFLYSLFARPAAYLLDRPLTWGGSWKLASAALMPGALLMSLTLLLYGLGILDVMRALIIAALHLAVGWVYVIAGTLALPRREPDAPSNPFSPSSTQIES